MNTQTIIKEMLTTFYPDGIQPNDYDKLGRIVEFAGKLTTNGAASSRGFEDESPVPTSVRQNTASPRIMKLDAPAQPPKRRGRPPKIRTESGEAGEGTIGGRALAILESDGPMTIDELADKLGTQATSVYPVLNKLEVSRFKGKFGGARRERVLYGPAGMKEKEMAAVAEKRTT